jgi:hypothetical protein
MLIENILSSLPAAVRSWFYRTSAGAEIDLVLEFGPKNIWAIGIKRSISNPVPSKGFYIGCADLKATRQIVLYPGKESYRINPRVEVLPWDQLVEQLPTPTRSNR